MAAQMRIASWWGAGAIAVLVAASAHGQTVSSSFDVVCVADPAKKQISGRKACLYGPTVLSFGNYVTLAVEHAPNVTFADEDEPDPAKLVLCLDGKPLPGTEASVGPSETDENDVTTTLLTFHITRDLSSDAARKAWTDVVTAAHQGHLLAISTGLPDGTAAESSAKAEFVAIRGGRLIGWCIAALAGIIGFFLIAARTGALRDQEPAGSGVKTTTERAFSLSRVQMALWAILVLYGYLFIWVLTGDYNVSIPESIVGLMGISLGTYGAAVAVDASKLQTSQARLAAAKAKSNVDPGDPALEAEVEASVPGTVVCKTEGFFQDLTTSAQGASLHRLQLMVWTVAMATVFVVTVWKTLAMPELSPTLLGLMGITSGTYVGLKLPESKS